MRSIARLALCWLIAAPLAAQGEVQDPTPVDTNAIRREAFAAEQRGDAGAAADAFLKLSELEPTEPNWVVRAADNLGRTGRFNEAMNLLEGARKRFPDVLSLPMMLARTYHLQADTMRSRGVVDANVIFQYQDAARVAGQILKIEPGHLEARLIIASALYETGDTEQALEHAERAVELNPDAYGGHAMVGRICFQRFLEAKQQLPTAAASGLDEAALQALMEDNREKARTAFESAARADAARGFPRAKLGDIAAWDGDMELALGWFGKALAVDPRSQIDHGWLRTAVDADRRRAFYADARGEYEARDDARPDAAATMLWYEAQAAFDQAARAPADTPGEDRTNRWKTAGDLFAATQTALPDYDDTYWWIVQARYWSGDVGAASSSAIEFARKAPRRFADMIRGDEQTIAALTGMAAQAFGRNRLADSRDLNRVLAYANQTADAWNNYAFLCRETREFDQSLRAYEAALQIEPESPQLMNDAGVILQYHIPGEPAKQRARQLYEDAIRLAERQLAEGELDADTTERTRTALRDARLNLAKMK